MSPDVNFWWLLLHMIKQSAGYSELCHLDNCSARASALLRLRILMSKKLDYPQWWAYKYNRLEFKPCRLGSKFKIRRLKAITDFIYWWTLRLLLFLFVSRTGTVGWTERWVPKCGLAITFLPSNSLHNLGGQKWSCPCYNTNNFEHFH